MHDPNPDLTASNIKYLLVIRELDAGRGVRCVDVAESLGVTKSSVSTMISILSGSDLVAQEKYGMIHLTDGGRELADMYAEGLVFLTSKLEGTLGLKKESCRNAACAIMAEMRGEDIAALGDKAGRHEAS